MADRAVRLNPFGRSRSEYESEYRCGKHEVPRKNIASGFGPLPLPFPLPLPLPFFSVGGAEFGLPRC